MSEKTKDLLRELGIPEAVINQTLQITQKEEEAVNLAFELMDNQTLPMIDPAPKNKPLETKPKGNL